ncbi:nuclear pore complex protein NUP1 isoform X1 [Capsicum galapagoense]
MEFNPTPTHYGNRGAGGKFKKPPARKPPATPYDRPPLNQQSRSSWISKLVDPAYRIISGSANRILPSFITNTIACNPPPLELIDGDLEDPAIQDAENDNKCTSSYRSTEGKEDNPSLGKLNGISEAEKLEEEKPKSSKSTEETEEDRSMEKSNGISKPEKLEEEKPKNSSDITEISRIEQLMQGKSFSRDEIMRLTEILNSRVVDEKENKASRAAEGEIGRFHLTHETPRRPNDRKHDETDFAMPGTSTPPQTNVRDEVGASPIDIAKAYMGSRRLSKGNDRYGFISKGEKVHPPPSPKSLICRPAAMVQDKHAHFTPLNQRGYGRVDFPRTPYSRTLLPKSRDGQTQSQTGSRWLDPSATPFQQSQSSIYSQEKTRTDLHLPSYGSVGPIRRIRNKFGSESRPRRSIFLNSTNASSPLEKVGASKLFLPAVGTNMEVGQTSGVEKYQSVDHRVGRSEEAMPHISSSNEAVRKILEQLDRHKPTPAEKAAELKLVSEWKKFPSKEISDSAPKGKMKSSNLGEFGMRMNNGMASSQSSKEGDKGMVNQLEISQERTTSEADTGTDASAKAASIANVFVTTTKADTVPAFTSKGANSQVKSFFSGSHTPSLRKDSIGTDDGQKDKGATPRWPFHNQSNGQNAETLSNSRRFELPRNAPGQASGAKPNLPSIFVNKPNLRNAASPDNGFGFSFPVPASSGAVSEPPTPSIVPSSAAGLSQPVDASTSPVYSFGTGKSAERLVFSFPSTSNSSVKADASDLKFSFGTDRTSRLSFGAIGKTTC